MKNVFYLVHNYVLKQLKVFAYMKKQDDVFHFNLKLENKGGWGGGGPHRESYDIIYRNGFRLIELTKYHRKF